MKKLLIVWGIIMGLNSSVAVAQPAEVVGVYKYFGDIAVAGDYAYAVSGSSEVQIINIFNPTQPIVVSSFNTGMKAARRIAIAGDYAYVGGYYRGGNRELQIINISNPTNPTFISSVKIGDWVRKISIVGDYAYVLSRVGLQIINISNPNNPTLAATFASSSNDMIISGDYAYVLSHGLQIINISNPNNPTLTASLIDEAYAEGMTISGDYAYISQGGILKIINISNPNNLTLTGSLEHGGIGYGGVAERDILILGDYAYITSGYSGIDIINISNPNNPTFTASLNTDHEFANSLTIVKNYIYVNGGEIIVKVENTNMENFVTRFYQKILNREPDVGGFAHWVSKLESLSKSGADIAKDFIFSEEFMGRGLDEEAYVNVLYSAFFNRVADEGGFYHWMNLLSDGSSREEVLDGFLKSAEFKTLADSYKIMPYATPIELFVSRFYKQTLRRLPDAEGLVYWNHKLSSGELSGADIAKKFIFSKEFKAKKLNNTDYINILYRAFFAREADKGGFNNWKSQLDVGLLSKEDVLDEFLSSDEFINLARTYGIRAE